MTTTFILHGTRTCNLIRNILFECNKFKNSFENCSIRAISSKVKDPFATPVETKKKIILPQITLLQADNAKTVMSLEAAEKLAKRRNMKLIKILDFEAHTERPLYKLLTDAEYRESEFHINSESPDGEKEEIKLKSEKLLQLSQRIAEHDLQFKIKKINQLLNKFHTVKVLVSQDGNTGEKTIKMLEVGIKGSGKIHKKIQKSTTVIYVIHPLLPNDNVENNSDKSKAIAHHAH